LKSASRAGSAKLSESRSTSRSGDALAKLDRLGLLVRNGDALSVLPLEAALLRLDGVWADFFRPKPGQESARRPA